MSKTQTPGSTMNVLGVLRADESSFTLGYFTALLAVLQHKKKYLFPQATVCLAILGHPPTWLNSFPIELPEIQFLFFTQLHELELFVEKHNPIACVPSDWKKSGSHDDYILFDEFRSASSAQMTDLIPFSNSLKIQVERYLSAQNSFAVAVHLKIQGEEGRQSNATLKTWETFFKKIALKHEVHFFLLGNDLYPAEMLKGKNITRVSEFNVRLPFQMELVHQVNAFMGMSSGFANTAIFNDKPYYILKTLDHHPGQIEEKLAAESRFCFSAPQQHFVRREENTDELVSFIEDTLNL